MDNPEKIKRLIGMSFALGLITVISMIFSALELADITGDAESDLTTKWNVVRLSFLFTFMFIAVSLVTIYKLSKINQGKNK